MAVQRAMPHLPRPVYSITELDMTKQALALFLILCLSAEAAEPTKPKSAVRVECHGQLRSGVVAIGGETTGTSIAFDRVIWDLKLADESGRNFAKDHHKKSVVVVGTLRRPNGVQIPDRWIIDVERIAEPDRATAKPGAEVTVEGILNASETGNSSEKKSGRSPDAVIETDGFSWPLDLSGDAEFLKQAMSRFGKPMIVKGQVERVGRLDSPHRLIIRVSKLESIE